MKKRKLNLKATVLSLGLAVGMMLPATHLNAQDWRGGLFGKNPKAEETENGLMQRGNRSTITDDGFTNANFGEEVPIAGGIAVLLAAGLGYVALKKKEDKQ